MTPPDEPFFEDRQEAGRELARNLRRYHARPGVLVLGIPRGGVVVAAEIARLLGLPLAAWVSRKVAAPQDPEFGIGAVSHGGVSVRDEAAMQRLRLSEADIEPVVREEKRELRRQLETYQGSRTPPDVRRRTVLLVDDGVARGWTARAAIQSLRMAGAERIVLALPVAAPEAAAELAMAADEVVVLEAPPRLLAVGTWYREFGQTSDEDVVSLLARAGPSGEMAA